MKTNQFLTANVLAAFLVCIFLRGETRVVMFATSLVASVLTATSIFSLASVTIPSHARMTLPAMLRRD